MPVAPPLRSPQDTLRSSADLEGMRAEDRRELVVRFELEVADEGAAGMRSPIMWMRHPLVGGVSDENFVRGYQRQSERVRREQ
eukprot:1189790-Prorocentrum_minimum.AAC.2